MRASRTGKTESSRNRDTIGRVVRLSYVRTETTTGIVPGLARRVRWGTRAGRTVGSAGALRDRWSARSLASVWPATAAEWECPAVDAVCEGLVESGAARPHLPGAARCLGEQRAAVGTHLYEARADLAIALDLAHSGTRRRLTVLDALTIGWAEVGVERLAAVPLVDERADMASLGYLRLRLRELYREATLTGRDVATDHLLVVVETEPVDGAHTGQRLVAETRLTTLHSALEYAFVGGESIVAVTPRRALALAARDEPRLTDSLARLRGELRLALEEGRLPSVRCWRQALPRRADELSLTLLGVID